MPCSLCQAENPDLEPLETACADCGSLPEDRAFVRFFREFIHPEQGARILDIAPPAPQLARLHRFVGPARYTAIGPLRLQEADQLTPPHRFLEMSITHLSFSDSSFDVIVCNHVLNYVRSDFLAMSEVHRCLNSRGLAFLNVKMELAKSERKGEGTGSPGTGREWTYGEDYFERLEAAGLFVLNVALAPLIGDTLEYAGMAPDAKQVICFKYRAPMDEFEARLRR